MLFFLFALPVPFCLVKRNEEEKNRKKKKKDIKRWGERKKRDFEILKFVAACNWFWIHPIARSIWIRSEVVFQNSFLIKNACKPVSYTWQNYFSFATPGKIIFPLQICFQMSYLATFKSIGNHVWSEVEVSFESLLESIFLTGKFCLSRLSYRSMKTSKSP